MFMDFNDHNNRGGGGGVPNIPVEARFWGPLNVDAYVKARIEGRPLVWSDLYPLLGVMILQHFFHPEQDVLPRTCASVSITRGTVKGSYFFGEPTDLRTVLHTASHHCPHTDRQDIDLAFANAKNFILTNGNDIAQMSPSSWGLYSQAPVKRHRII